MMDYIKDRGNPFEDSNLVPKNFKTGKLMEKSLANSLINAIEIGEKEYLTFKEQRLEKNYQTLRYYSECQDGRKNTVIEEST